MGAGGLKCRAVVPSSSDVTGIKQLIAAVGLFPPDMIDGMIAPYLLGQTEGRWLVGVGRGTSGHEEVVGVAYYIPPPFFLMTTGTWNILLLAVLPEQQGRGVGKAMVRHITDELQRGTDGRLLLVETSSLPESAPSGAFFARVGFTEEGRVRDYFAEGEDKVVFSMKLGAPKK